MENLFTPWRYVYLSSGRKVKRCIFCKARDARDDASHLVVHRGRHNFVILNRYPYNNGHLMIVPYAHRSDLSDGTPSQLREMMLLASRCAKALQTTYRPDGLNLGMNLGSAAGAGVLGHFHLHLVPRWEGDTNFMTVVGRTRVTPESLEETHRKLASRLTPQHARAVRSKSPPVRRRS
jgi:ATP adenylyltransferase